MRELDDWRAAHPLPRLLGETSKTARGRVLAVGGCRRVPGAIRLTAEAALRVGAGRVRIATLEELGPALGAAFPEAGVIGLPADGAGEIAGGAADVLREQVAIHHAAVLGPGMFSQDAAARLVRALADAPPPETALVLDAAAVACAGPLRALLGPFAGRLVLTPHHGEMAALTGLSVGAIEADGAGAALDVAERYRAVVALKGVETVVAAPGGTVLHYPGGGRGLATGGSGDVLAGAIAGLLARGAPPLTAAAWGVWLHGEAGRVLAGETGPIGFLARELLPVLPRLLPR